MARVPYSPVPEVSPSAQAIGGVSAEAPADAFGSGIANAVGDLGRTTSAAGDELFQRAYAMQQLANESAARDADATYTIEVGKLHAEFNSLQGKEAVDAFPSYQKNINELRQKIGGSLGNPQTRRMFEASARSTMARTIFNGAGHAATQNKKYAIGTIQAQIELDGQTVADSPGDDRLFQEKLAKTRVGVIQLSALAGFDPGGPQEKNAVLEAESKLWANRVVGLSRTNPIGAQTMLDKNKTSMTEADFLRVESTVRNQARSIGSANIAEEVYSVDKPFEQMVEEAKAKAKALYPDDPIFEKNAIAAVKGHYNQQKYAEQRERIENRQTIAGAIQSGVRNEQELRADPKIANAIDSLPKTEQLAIPGQINRYNAARDRETNQETFQRLYGLSNNDVEAFLNTDLTAEKLSQTDMRSLFLRQQKMKENPTADPRVTRAVGWMRGALGSQMEALGVYSRKADNVEAYDNFTGALQIALDTYQDVHKKPASYDDVVKTIGPQIIQQRTVPGFFGMLLGGNQKAFFDQEVPEDVAERIKADVVAKGGTPPTDQQVLRAWTRMEYNRLYGPKKDQGRAPQ